VIRALLIPKWIFSQLILSLPVTTHAVGGTAAKPAKLIIAAEIRTTNFFIINTS